MWDMSPNGMRHCVSASSQAVVLALADCVCAISLGSPHPADMRYPSLLAAAWRARMRQLDTPAAAAAEAGHARWLELLQDARQHAEDCARAGNGSHLKALHDFDDIF